LGSKGAEKRHKEMLREQAYDFKILTKFDNICRFAFGEGEQVPEKPQMSLQQAFLA
jgi:hypothetical protein